MKTSRLIRRTTEHVGLYLARVSRKSYSDPQPWSAQIEDDAGAHIATVHSITEDLARTSAAFIVEAVNVHAGLVADNARLRAALAMTEARLTALFSMELSIDHDKNRTPQRLSIRADMWKTIDLARAALAGTGGTL